MVCYDEMDPDKAVVLVTFEGGGSIYSDDLNNVALSHGNGLVATSRYLHSAEVQKAGPPRVINLDIYRILNPLA